MFAWSTFDAFNNKFDWYWDGDNGVGDGDGDEHIDEFEDSIGDDTDEDEDKDEGDETTVLDLGENTVGDTIVVLAFDAYLIIEDESELNKVFVRIFLSATNVSFSWVWWFKLEDNELSTLSRCSCLVVCLDECKVLLLLLIFSVGWHLDEIISNLLLDLFVLWEALFELLFALFSLIELDAEAFKSK